jgi:hypothetical protein
MVPSCILMDWTRANLISTVDPRAYPDVEVGNDEAERTSVGNHDRPDKECTTYNGTYLQRW